MNDTMIIDESVFANIAIDETVIGVLAQASPFAYELFIRHYETINRFIADFPLAMPLSQPMILALIDGYTHSNTTNTTHTCDGINGDEVAKQLRRLRQRLMVRWIWQDALGVIPLERLMMELSFFADGVINFAKDFVYDGLVQKFGEPKVLQGRVYQKDELAIIAMGKLGAMELNLSSDIDLIFVHLGAGQTEGKHPANRLIDNQKFMLLLGQAIIRLINDVSEEGFVFRVDMRLRPWGDGSPLVMTLAGLQNYLDKHGRTWERFAWLKARVVNPVSDSFLTALMTARKNFVFRYYVDYSAFSALREMKTLILNQVAQREDSDNVKLGVGGIRDIEFIAQSFALIYGGRDNRLTQITACLPALALLGELGLIDTAVADRLSLAYRFFRRLEHAIQARHDQQTQKLPTGDERLALAKTLGFDDGEQLYNRLTAYRQMVCVPFDELVMKRDYAGATLNSDETINQANNQAKLHRHLDEQTLKQWYGFWQGKAVNELSDEAKQRLQRAYPVIMHALVQFLMQEGQGTLVVPRLVALLEAVCRRSIYLVMLSENPKATMDLIPMLATSSWIANELLAYPVLLDTFLQKRYRHLPSKTELMAILSQSLLSVAQGDDEAFLMSLRLFKKTQMLAVATSDVLRQHPIMKVSDSLTLIAEVVLECCLKRAFIELAQKHGYPKDCDGNRLDERHCGFAIIGYGKLGGIEMGYASDLDVVFLHRLSTEAMTDGNQPISGMKFAIRLVQKIINYLTTQTRDGRAYELDMRLRPSGNAGVMVVASRAFAEYQAHKAWVWEHQALVRARGICGDNQLLAEFDAIRQAILVKPRDTIALKQEIVAMRQKMYRAIKHDPTQFHLKKDAGGLIDIEFMAQFCVLNYAYAYPKLAIWSDNIRIFETVAECGIWDQKLCQSLNELYLLLRKRIHKKSLSEQKPLVASDEWQAYRQKIIAIWQGLFGKPDLMG